MTTNPYYIALACKLYKWMDTFWSPIVHPASPFVWLIDKIKSDCPYCTNARTAAIAAGVTALFFGHFLTGLVAVGGVAFIVAVERTAACAEKPTKPN
jgi:hypothetical protein